MADQYSEGLLEAWRFDGEGGGTRLSWDEVHALDPISDGFVWLHFRCLPKQPQQWLREHSGIDRIIMEGMLDDESRPRCSLFSDSAFLVLRGVNLQRNSLPRTCSACICGWSRAASSRFSTNPFPPSRTMWIPSPAARKARTQGEMVADLSLRLVDRLDTVIAALMDEADELEDAVETSEARDLLPKLSVLRRRLHQAAPAYRPPARGAEPFLNRG